MHRNPIRSCVRLGSAALLSAGMLAPVSVPAATTFRIVMVQTLSGVEDEATETGELTGTPRSGLLSNPFTQHSASYDYFPGAIGVERLHSEGEWSMGNGTDSLFGTFRTTASSVPGTSELLTLFTGESHIIGGTGAFAGASGGGTFESFLSYVDPPAGITYRGVDIARLTVIVPGTGAGIEVDSRNAVVLYKEGFEDPAAGTGWNSGVATSSGPLDPETATSSFTEYTFAGSSVSGTTTTTFINGDSIVDESTSDVVLDANGMAYIPDGRYDIVSATGNRISTVGSGGTYEAFTLFGPAGYASVTVARAGFLTPVPEPAAWLQLLGGFGLLLATMGLRRAQAGRPCRDSVRRG